MELEAAAAVVTLEGAGETILNGSGGRGGLVPVW